MKTKTLDQAQVTELIQEWQQALDHLMSTVAEWIRDLPGWTIQPSNKETSEEVLGVYPAPVLTIDTPEGQVILEPMARLVFGGRGIVEMFAWPSLYRVRLIRRPDREDWEILTDSGIKLKQPWNRETFIELTQDLIGAG